MRRSAVVHTGDIGAGNVTKLANQVIVALNIAAMSEALTLATKAGVNPDLVYQAIRGGLAGSTVLDAKAPMVMDRNFKPGFRHGDDAGAACRWDGHRRSQRARMLLRKTGESGSHSLTRRARMRAL